MHMTPELVQLLCQPGVVQFIQFLKQRGLTTALQDMHSNIHLDHGSTEAHAAAAGAPVGSQTPPVLTHSLTARPQSAVSPRGAAGHAHDSAHAHPSRHPGGRHSLPYGSSIQLHPESAGQARAHHVSANDASAQGHGLDLAFLQAAPLATSDAPLELLLERQQLQRNLDECFRSVRVRFDVATPNNMLQMLLKGARCIHISGHGDLNSLLLESDRNCGQEHPLNATALKDMLNECSAQLRDNSATAGAAPPLSLVVISACFSARAAEAFVLAGVPHVVAVHEDTRVTDEAACAFTQNFYLALLEGNTVQQAFNVARAGVQIRLQSDFQQQPPHPSHGGGLAESKTATASAGAGVGMGAVPPPQQGQAQSGRNLEICCCAHAHDCGPCTSCRMPKCCSVHYARARPCHTLVPCCRADLPHSEYLKFVLLPDGPHHDVKLFEGLKEGPWVDCTPAPIPHDIPALHAPFVGRAHPARQVLQAVSRSRLVTLLGARGVGKSALARLIATYLKDRYGHPACACTVA